MAQMTVAAALGHEEPDHWELHAADTIEAGRGLCDEPLPGCSARTVPPNPRNGRVGCRWARHNGNRAAERTGARSAALCYVDFLNTGPAVATTLRTTVNRTNGLRNACERRVVESWSTTATSGGPSRWMWCPGEAVRSKQRQSSWLPAG